MPHASRDIGRRACAAPRVSSDRCFALVTTTEGRCERPPAQSGRRSGRNLHFPSRRTARPHHPGGRGRDRRVPRARLLGARHLPAACAAADGEPAERRQDDRDRRHRLVLRADEGDDARRARDRAACRAVPDLGVRSAWALSAREEARRAARRQQLRAVPLRDGVRVLPRISDDFPRDGALQRAARCRDVDRYRQLPELRARDVRCIRRDVRGADRRRAARAHGCADRAKAQGDPSVRDRRRVRRRGRRDAARRVLAADARAAARAAVRGRHYRGAAFRETAREGRGREQGHGELTALAGRGRPAPGVRFRGAAARISRAAKAAEASRDCSRRRSIRAGPRCASRPSRRRRRLAGMAARNEKGNPVDCLFVCRRASRSRRPGRRHRRAAPRPCRRPSSACLARVRGARRRSLLLVAVLVVERLLRRRRPLADHDGDVELLALAHHVNLRRRAGLDLRDDVQQLRRIGDVLAVDRHQNIARLDARLVGRAALQHARNDRARFLRKAERFGDLRRHVLRLDADPAARDGARRDDALEHVARGRHGDREADAERAARARVDRRIDAEQVAVYVDERAARIARVDRRVGLDEVLERVDAEVVAPERADDPHRDRLADPERVADREHDVAHARLVGAAERDRR
ncbi:hypothetical protein BURPS1710b_3679 [Burkholderia pseudomallei 1710b]|uniref:Uncharacterized protein n=1 Tax=Burkholderia pseudomallei (strain 1710b) TaxID=320372 RepID=Q3JN10_BURP1|nr:hypothetical protein BURPS1710b_3679 [Burkholderia pseudomallei 1710b]